MPFTFLRTEVGVQRGLLVLAVFYYLLLGFIIQFTIPEYTHICTYRDILGILAVLLLIASYFKPVQNLLDKALYTYFALSMYWVLHVLSESYLAPENGLLLLVFFIIVSLGIKKLKIYRWFILLFSAALAYVVLSVDDPQTPGWLFGGLYAISALLTYQLLVNYKGIEHALRRSNKDMIQLLDQIDECFFLIDTDLNIRKFNHKAFETIFTYQNKKLQEGRKFTDYYKPSVDSTFDAAIKDCLNGISTKYDHKSVYKVGKEEIVRWYLLKFIPVFNEAKEVKNIVFTALDITDHYDSSEKFVRSELMFKNLFRKAPIGMALTDEKGMVIEANEAYCQTVGYTQEEVVNRTFADYTHPDDLDYNFDLLKQLLNREINEYQLEKRYVRKNGKIIYVIVRVIVLKGLEGKDQLLAQVIDITRLKKVEDILKLKNRELQIGNKNLAKMNEELERTNMELDRFIYSASHDLRAPLASMLGLINLSKLDENLKGNEYLDLMEKSINRLERFIGEVIQFSANARTGLTFELITDLSTIIREVVDGLKFSKEATGIDIEIKVDDFNSFKIDKRRLEMILNNLISNAIKYHDRSKSKMFVKVAAYLSEDMLNIEISDNGIGIAKDHQDKIFDFFYRAHEHSTGAGLGLYIVKQTIRKMKGKILVESEVGVGTKFKIVLPVEYITDTRNVA